MRATRLRRGYGVPSKLRDADKFDLQLRKRSVAPTELYALTLCYGSLTTFNSSGSIWLLPN